MDCETKSRHSRTEPARSGPASAPGRRPACSRVHRVLHPERTWPALPPGLLAAQPQRLRPVGEASTHAVGAAAAGRGPRAHACAALPPPAWQPRLLAWLRGLPLHPGQSGQWPAALRTLEVRQRHGQSSVGLHCSIFSLMRARRGQQHPRQAQVRLHGRHWERQACQRPECQAQACCCCSQSAQTQQPHRPRRTACAARTCEQASPGAAGRGALGTASAGALLGGSGRGPNTSACHGCCAAAAAAAAALGAELAASLR